MVISFKILVAACSLLVYRKVINFCALTLYPTALLKSLIISSSFCCCCCSCWFFKTSTGDNHVIYEERQFYFFSMYIPFTAFYWHCISYDFMYRPFVSLSTFIPRYFILFDLMISGIVSLISVSDHSFLMYRNATDFFVLILYPATFLKPLISFSSFLVAFSGFSMFSITY